MKINSSKVQETDYGFGNGKEGIQVGNMRLQRYRIVCYVLLETNSKNRLTYKVNHDVDQQFYNSQAWHTVYSFTVTVSE